MLAATELISSADGGYAQRERQGSRVPLKAITHSISDELNSSPPGSMRGEINYSKVVKICEKTGDLQEELVTLGPSPTTPIDLE